MKIGSREFDFGRHTYIMGILNLIHFLMVVDLILWIKLYFMRKK